MTEAEVTRHLTTRNDESEPERRPRYRGETCALQDRSVSVDEPEVTRREQGQTPKATAPLTRLLGRR